MEVGVFGARLHTMSGEPVKYVRYDDTFQVVVVDHRDGTRLRVPLGALVNGRGDKIVHDEEAEASLEATVLKRWSQAKWRLDDGRVGTLRDVVTFASSDYVNITKLSLKLDDGSVITQDIRLLTPVASR
jgi:class 3 adenylate cyclase